MKVVCIIPARLLSQRFPRKVLTKLGNRPLLQWVYEAAKKVSAFDEVHVAVDAQETFDLAHSIGASTFFTSPSCRNGTERLIELLSSKHVDGDLFVNWQADEPFVEERMIRDLLPRSKGSFDVWTLKKRLDSDQENPHNVKVVCDGRGRALYFSRARIPVSGPCFKHIGIYAYSKKALMKIAQMKPCQLESQESLEQLRFLYHGLQIKVTETERDSIGIDTLEDLRSAESLIRDKMLV